MASVAVLVRLPCHGVALEGPFEIAVGVSALGQVGDLSRFDVDEGDVGIVPSSVCLIEGEQIFAVRAPFEALVSVLVGIVDVLEQGFLLPVLGGLYDKFGPVPEECYPLAVRGDVRLEAGLLF